MLVLADSQMCLTTTTSQHGLCVCGGGVNINVRVSDVVTNPGGSL